MTSWLESHMSLEISSNTEFLLVAVGILLVTKYT